MPIPHFSQKIRKRIAATAAVFTTALSMSAAFSASASAQTATAKTNIKFKVQPFVRLYYRENVNINISPTASSTKVKPGGTVKIDATYDPVNGVTGSGDAKVKADKLATKGNVQLTNFWAVHSIANNGTKVSLKVADDTACHNRFKTSCIKVTGVTPKNSKFDPTGLKQAKFGDATLSLDIGDVTHSGNYTSDGAAIEISATNF